MFFALFFSDKSFDSTWQQRRVIVTKEMIYFAFVESDEEVDRVPLAGVDFVKNYNENLAVQSKSAHDQDHFCLQVATNSLGYNSGRSYMLRTDSRTIHSELILDLSQLSKVARKRAIATTNVQLIQLRVKKFYERDFCQGLVATVIMAVRA